MIQTKKSKKFPRGKNVLLHILSINGKTAFSLVSKKQESHNFVTVLSQILFVSKTQLVDFIHY